MSNLLEEGKLQEVLEKSQGQLRTLLGELSERVDDVLEKHGELTQKVQDKLGEQELSERLSKAIEDLIEAQTKLSQNVAQAIKDLVERILESLPEAEEAAEEAPKAKKAPAKKPAARKVAAKKPAARKSSTRKAS